MHRYGMLIFIHHNLLNTIFRKKLTQASLQTTAKYTISLE